MGFLKNKLGTSEINYNEVPLNIRLRPYFIVLPGMLILIGIMIPFITAIWLSLTDATFRVPMDRWRFIGFGQWRNMFTNPNFLHTVSVTLRYAISATTVQLLLGMGLAFLLHKDSRYTRVLKVLFMFPLMVAPVIAVLIWQLMLSNSIGIVERLLNVFGIFNFPWASAPQTAMMTVVFIDTWVNTPFMMLLILAGINSLPKSPFEAAQVDGASSWFTFRKLVLPMLKPFILIAVLFRAMASLQEFGIIFATTGGGPGNTLMGISITSYLTAFTFQRLASAMPYLLTLWVFINIVANVIVRAQRKSAKEAAGL